VPIDSDELIEMSIQISLGKTEPPSSYNREQRNAWERLLRQIREIEAKGGSVDLPFELP
jgi:hypothetical protein